MTIASNITAIQGVGAKNSSSGMAKGQAPQDLLSFLGSILQQLQVGNTAAPASAQNSAAGLKGVTEKVTDELKKQGLTLETLQKMSPEELTEKISGVLQQQNIALPAFLQNIAPQDLAGKIAAAIQKTGLLAGASAVKPSLTSDLLAPQTSQQAQDTTTPGAAALDPAILQQLKDKVAQEQTAANAGTPGAIAQLKTDILQFLNDQGLDETTAMPYLAALAQSLKPAAPAAASMTDGTDAVTLATFSARQPADGDTASLPTAPPVPRSNDPVAGLQPKGILTKNAATPGQVGNAASHAPATTAATAQAATGTQAPASSAPQNLTAKIAGHNGINPALINDLANSNDGSGFSSGGFNAQQDAPAQTMTSTSALTQPLSADGLNTQNFTNYLSAARDTASPTVQMVNVQIQRNVGAGVNSMTLQLEPMELGRLDVKLKFSKDGTVKAHMTVDKPETLALLQKDSHHLQRALEQTGLDMDENSISFDLRQQDRQETEHSDGFGGRQAAFNAAGDDAANDAALQAQLAIHAYGYISASGVNIIV